MPITVKEREQARRGSQTDKGYQFTREYAIESDVDIDEFDALSAIGVPGFGQAHPKVSIARVNNRSAAPLAANQGHLRNWVVTVQYAIPEEDEDQSDIHPLDREPDVSWFSVTFTKVVQKDVKTGKAIANSATVQLDPLPEADDARPGVRIGVNKAFFSASEILQFCNHVNSDGFLGADAGKAKVASISATRTREEFEGETVVYWRCEYEIHFRKEGWKHEQVDNGFMERIDGELKRIEKNGQPIPEAAFLDGNGRELADDAEVVFLEFDIYEEASFQGMDLRV